MMYNVHSRIWIRQSIFSQKLVDLLIVIFIAHLHLQNASAFQLTRRKKFIINSARAERFNQR